MTSAGMAGMTVESTFLSLECNTSWLTLSTGLEDPVRFVSQGCIDPIRPPLQGGTDSVIPPLLGIVDSFGTSLQGVSPRKWFPAPAQRGYTPQCRRWTPSRSVTGSSSLVQYAQDWSCIQYG